MLAPDRESTVLPQTRSRRRRDWGRAVARVLCVLFALVGALPVGVAFLLRSAAVRDWATRETSRILREQNIQATYQIEARLWPLSIEVKQLRVESTDGGAPALVAARVIAKPKVFALLAGKLVIEQLDVESPKVRLVLKDGKIQNLSLPETREERDQKKVQRAPFGVIAMTEATIDVDIDGVRVAANEVDADVTVDNDPGRDSAYEVALRVGSGVVQRVRSVEVKGQPSKMEIDEDSFCMVDGRVRVERDLVLVRRLSATASADLDHASGSAPPCDLPKEDKRRVELALAHLRVGLPEKAGDLPTLEGHVAARAPLGIVMRLPGAPPTDGWVAVDGDLRLGRGGKIPDFSGRVEGHGLHVGRYSISAEVKSEVSARGGVITSPLTTVRIAKGLARLSDVSVDLNKPELPLKAKVDVADVSFSALMQDLGVTKHPHVSWDIHEVRVASFKGTMNPLKLDGEVFSRTSNFAVFDVDVDNPAKKRLIGFREAAFTAHLAVRPDALIWSNLHANLGRSTIDGGYCSIGFHEDLAVEAPRSKVDLRDISPLADIPMAGVAEASVTVKGKFNDPRVEGESKIDGFVLGDIPFGNVSQSQIAFQGDVVELKNVKATKGKSPYEMPTARLDFGQSGMVMDGIALSSALNIRDFFALWHLEDDPRFVEIDGTFASRASIHFALGGKEDKCGGGYLDVSATLRAKSLMLFGEPFDDGTAEMEYRWLDRDAGIEGADIDIRALTLHKNGRGGRTSGSLLGSATIRRGGELRGNMVLDALPLSRFGALGPMANKVDGTVSGVARVTGTLDAYKIEGDVDVTPIRIGGAAFGSSQLHVGMTQNPSGQKPVGKTRCGGNVFPLFDREAYVRSTASQGEFTASGAALGGQMRIDDLRMSRQKSARISGVLGLRQLDLKQLGRFAQAEEAAAKPDAPAPSEPVGGELTGELKIERLVLDDLAHAAARFTPQSIVVARSGQKLTMRPTTSVLAMENDSIAVPPLVFDLTAANGLKGAFTLRGSVSRVTRDPSLALTADLAPIDLGLLVGVVPRVTRAQGTLAGSLRVSGRAASPDLDGALRVRGAELAIQGLPGALSEVDVDLVADENEVRVTRAVGKLAGGDVSATARVPVRGLSLGTLESNIVARDIHLVPSDGVKATVDANLVLTYTPQTSVGATPRLPQLSGEVQLTSFEYTRPMLIELAGTLGKVGTATRTVIDTYDPSQDSLRIDVNVRARAPLKFKNNLVDVQLAVDSQGLAVTGTNQRVGLKGELRALQGGRLRVFSNDFEVKQAQVRFDDPTRIAPNFDVVAVTEYRRYSTVTGANAQVGSTAGTGNSWRITAHVFGDPENVKMDLTSEPPLSRDDIQLLLTVRLTRAELDQLRGASGYAGLAYEAAGFLGQDALKSAVPVVDDFRFGSAYSPRTGKVEPQVTASKRLTDDVHASVSKFLTEDSQLRSNVELRLSRRLSVQGTFDNVGSVNGTAANVGGVDIKNVGVDLRYRIEFE